MMIDIEDIKFALDKLSEREYTHYRELLARIERLEELYEDEGKNMRNLQDGNGRRKVCGKGLSLSEVCGL